MGLVFIGSSREALEKGIVKKLSNALTKHKLSPLPWPGQFNPGDITINRLREISSFVDAAILVWDADIETWHRNAHHKAARDNCLVEYGMFLDRLGLKRAGLFVNKDVTPPSDVDGMTYVSYDGMNDSDIESKAETLVRSIGRAILERKPTLIVPKCPDNKFYAYRTKQLNVPSTWATRAAYFTPESAQYWMQMVRRSDYGLNPARDIYGLRELRLRAIDNLRFNTALLLGAGGGESEWAIVSHIAQECPNIECIPLDINDYLLDYVVQEFRGRRDVFMPACICGDYEDSPAVVGSILNDHAKKRPMLILMIGNSFANLDTNERNLFSNVTTWMKEGDFILIDFSIRGKDWTRDNESRANPKAYPAEFKDMLLRGLAMHHSDPEITPENIVAEAVEFDDVVSVLWTPQNSAIPNTETLLVQRQNTQRAMFWFRRYDFDDAVKWFRTLKTFEVVGKPLKTEPMSPDILGMGVVLLRKVPIQH